MDDLAHVGVMLFLHKNNLEISTVGELPPYELSLNTSYFTLATGNSQLNLIKHSDIANIII